MNRRETLKILGLGALTPTSWLGERTAVDDASAFASDWHEWPDMRWIGPAYWGNRLQDWLVREGAAVCATHGSNRALHCLTYRLKPDAQPFEAQVELQFLEPRSNLASGYAGFRIGAVGPIPDYRSAAVFGEGLDVGVTRAGRLFIGDETGTGSIPTDQPIRLRLQAQPVGSGYELTLSALEEMDSASLGSFTATLQSGQDLTGNVALVSHFVDDGLADVPSVQFRGWAMGGDKLLHDPEATFGPICFAQYTLNRGTLKLTAQLAPIEELRGHRVTLETKEEGVWRHRGTSAVDPLARIAHFRLEEWRRRDDVPYRIRVDLPLREGTRTYYYEGAIAHEPSELERLKLAVFSCNRDHGFPDTEVVVNVNKHRPHLAVFLGDQYYEGNGGFGIQTGPLEKSSLDCLHKWYMFGWSYRDIFRRIPAAFLTDDHDVYHGNIWGAGGRRAPVERGWNHASQDGGGYKMEPVWVNVVHRMQTSHLPDPFDPIPVEQGISVYYTRWDYAGVSFALLSDRGFKSAPRETLPPEAQVVNGFITNPQFDVRAHRDLPKAELLGERQERFLEAWCGDWSGSVEMKAVLSQSPFCAVHTLPEGSTTDAMVPDLPIPEPGFYVRGDAPVRDMDTNGWPQNRRDEAVRLLRRCFAFHIAGDQHLATVVQYGVDEFEDSGFAFTGPALNNTFPRRWWPPPEAKEYTLPDKPAYTGGFFDGFGNRITVYAAANPRQTGRRPAIVYDRVTGYGMVTFDKAARTVHVECWPRYVDPLQDPGGQYSGWPMTISQTDNYGRTPTAWLPELRISGATNPVVEVVDQSSGETQYVLRIRGSTFRPWVFGPGPFMVRVTDPDRDLLAEERNLEATELNDEVLHIVLAS